ncbi:MAG: ABC transporter ATP-binding protein, partial [Treponema sp.]|nr:ABC transporter ATP-binding protein [Treponema sp.]
PHFTVKENLLYGLKIKNKKEKVPSKEFYKNAESLIQQSARLLGLVGLLDRFPHELSGGQQQRVALGRALILKPKILLMDEPLSSLDAKLRNQVRDELKEIQKDFGITTIYVTHDQEEALYLSDKIAVMNHGQIQQIGSPEEIYFKPKNKFVADFVGKANFIEEENACFIVRPEWINLKKSDSKNSENKIISKTFLGSTIRYKIGTNKTKNGILIVDKSSNDSEVFNPGDYVKINILQDWKTEP